MHCRLGPGTKHKCNIMLYSILFYDIGLQLVQICLAKLTLAVLDAGSKDEMIIIWGFRV